MHVLDVFTRDEESCVFIARRAALCPGSWCVVVVVAQLASLSTGYMDLLAAPDLHCFFSNARTMRWLLSKILFGGSL